MVVASLDYHHVACVVCVCGGGGGGAEQKNLKKIKNLLFLRL